MAAGGLPGTHSAQTAPPVALQTFSGLQLGPAPYWKKRAPNCLPGGHPGPWSPSHGAVGRSQQPQAIPSLQAGLTPLWASLGTSGAVCTAHSDRHNLEGEVTLCKRKFLLSVQMRGPNATNTGIISCGRFYPEQEVQNVSGAHPDRQQGAHPEGGVEVDVVGAAHLMVPFFRAVQDGDANGSSPV